MAPKRDDRKFRQEAVSLVNAAVGGDVITDVFFYGLGHADYGWDGQ